MFIVVDLVSLTVTVDRVVYSEGSEMQLEIFLSFLNTDFCVSYIFSSSFYTTYSTIMVICDKYM